MKENKKIGFSKWLFVSSKYVVRHIPSWAKEIYKSDAFPLFQVAFSYLLSVMFFVFIVTAPVSITWTILFGFSGIVFALISLYGLYRICGGGS